MERVYQFAEFQLDAANNRLFSLNEVVPAETKNLRLIELLIQHAPNLVSKEDLMAELWPDQIVSDWSLSRLVSDTRILLGDTGKEQSIIKTERGKGFRFVAEYCVVTQNAPSSLKVTNDTKRKGRKIVWAVLALLLITVTCVVLLLPENLQSTNLAVVSPIFAKTDANDKDFNFQPELNSIETQKQLMLKLQLALQKTKVAFIAQARRRNELRDLIEKRLNISRDESYEQFFAKHYSTLTLQEQFIFNQIKSITEGSMLQGNQRIAQLLQSHPDILQSHEIFQQLYQHITFWLNKYQEFYLKRADMCLVYVGVEDGVPFPSKIDDYVESWLNKHIKTQLILEINAS